MFKRATRLLIACIAYLLCTSSASGQNIGFGTTTPRAKLEVVGVAGSGATSGIFGSDGAGISIQRNWPTIGFNQYRDVIVPGSQGKYMSNGFAAIQYFDPNSGTFAIDMFSSGSANTSTPAAIRALTVLANGNVGIKTGSPNATLTVARGDGIDGTAVFAGSPIWSHINYDVAENTYIRGGNDGSNVYINKIPRGDVFIGGGNCRIGINKSAPVYTIDLVQPHGVRAVALHDGFGYSWGQQLNPTNTQSHGHGVPLDFYYGTQAKGRFQFWDGHYQTFSDRRLKTNIKPLADVLQKLADAKPVMYEMKDQEVKGKMSIGFLAQEIQPLFPELVRQVKNDSRSGRAVTDLKVMNYTALNVIAIKALQEQYLQIKALEQETVELMQRLEKLDKKLAQ